ncbi:MULTISPECIES: thiol-disulfide oxidoreductase DCC family protein [unclassified Leeuwenhoekiella]|uniref:thiol-disulfide oxidoreductase DCC family protein n=1 Tax=unclassified Leeuwenhoekiella TaxID=2615029 RepID=UPI00048DC97D|nr:thiol-disulfide oxidoreductase DCC family protein [Leeuwenhoekiella sp. MAR_2009_132]
MDSKIILFDGVCNLCNGAINFIIKQDSKAVFKFASLQSETGMRLLKKHKIDPQKTDSIILVEEDKVSVKSTAALRISRFLDKGYPLLYGFMIIPGFIRNYVYDFIARNRYKWFGKKESCMIPTPELKSRFLE